MDKIKAIIRNSPIVIAVIYIITGFLWIQFSDQIVLSLFDEADDITRVQSLKGWFFVVVSGVLIFFLVRKNNALLDEVIVDLTKSRDKFYATFEQAPVGIVHHRPNEKWIEINQTLCDILGYSKSELLKLNFEDFIHPEDLQSSRNLDQKLLDGQRKIYQIKKRYKTKEGRYIHGMLTKSAVITNKHSTTYLVGIVQDISKKIEADEKIKQSLHEKELLLAEIHHRVKNNLALMSSLIELEYLFTNNPNTKSVLEKSKLRVKCLSVIYNTFSEDDQTTSVNFSSFLLQMNEQLNQKFEKDNRRIIFKNRNPSIFININQAIPFSLLYNEVLLMIHSKSSCPEVTINLLNDKNDITLKILDYDTENLWSTLVKETDDPASEIINTLITQLNGEISINSSEKGNVLQLLFRKNELKGTGCALDINNLKTH